MQVDEKKLNPQDFESKWQKIWEERRIYQPDLSNAKKPYYNLMMFPYPSAEGLHVGNMYAFTGVDIHGRFKRMQGYDVFEPIGLDGFGIHSENYAIKIGKHPKEQAKISEKNFYRQLKAIGNGFAWENRLETYDPDYYRWTQWIFVRMFKAGLAYRKKSPVNFCPSCKTVLSDEQVIDGACERCKSVVEKRDMEQWYFRITKYADKLLKNIKKLEWTNKVKIGQRNWIGKKTGINIRYQVSGVRYQIECFTTRPDTNFGATFVVVGPENPFVSYLLSLPKLPESLKQLISAYVAKAKKTSEADRITAGHKKTGVFTGFYAVNQLNGYKMPIYISDFVLGNVGTGAVVGVPGHDLRDFEFAKEFDIPIIRVVVGKDGDKSPITRPEQVQEQEGTMINSEFLNGLDIHLATVKMMDHLAEKGWGKRVVEYKLRDWCISRQRYWGAPIPMIFCSTCAEKGVGWFPVPEDQLPVQLPDLDDWKPEGTGKGPLAKIESFVKTKCPQCGGKAVRETDVCDTFLDSSWYFLRYPSVKTNTIQDRKANPILDRKQLPWDPQITRKWLPVTQYIGGAEHTVLHLLYSRFIWMCFYDWGLFDFSAKSKHLGGPATMPRALGWEEPFRRFYAHGLIIAEGAKMSKSRGNVVIPDEYIRKYGADTLRTYLMFLGPFDMGGDFKDTGIAGMYRFLSRVWRLVIDSLSPRSPKSLKENDKLEKIMHHTIKVVTEDLEKLRYNTAIAHIMEYVNQITDNREPSFAPTCVGATAGKQITINNIRTLLLLLAPFAPHMTEELWQKLSSKYQVESSKDEKLNNKHATYYLLHTTESIHLHPWPKYDPKYLVEDEVTIVVQINGKTREVIKIALKHLGGSRMDSPEVEESVVTIAKNSEKVKKHLEGKTVRKVIFVPGKLINFVVI